MLRTALLPAVWQLLILILLSALTPTATGTHLKSIACTRGVNLRGGRLVCHDRSTTESWAQLQWRLYEAEAIPPPPQSCEVTTMAIEVRVPAPVIDNAVGTSNANNANGTSGAGVSGVPSAQLYNTTIIAGGRHYLPTELNATVAEVADRDPHYAKYETTWSAEVAMTINGWVDPLANYQLCDVTFASDTAAVEDLTCTC